MQSELTIHSGWQVGGAPMYPVIQVHTACWFMLRQILFGPHGEGLQGSWTTETNEWINYLWISVKIKHELVVLTVFVKLLWWGRHSINAFPDIPSGHLHIGIWL